MTGDRVQAIVEITQNRLLDLFAFANDNAIIKIPWILALEHGNVVEIVDEDAIEKFPTKAPFEEHVAAVATGNFKALLIDCDN